MNVGKIIDSLLDGVIALYPKVAPQQTTGTHAVYHVISNTPTDVKESASVVDIVRVQISIFANTYAALQTAAESVRSTLDYFQGTTNSIAVDLIRYENETDDYEMDTNEYMISQDYFIRIKNESTT